MDWSRYLPKVPGDYQGPAPAFYFLVLIAIISTVRSLIHMFALDGGAHSIAGLAIDVAGGTNLIAIFSQWGSSQLILAIVYWVGILRYRFLVPFMLSIVVLEQVLRIGMGLVKPVEVASAPPGKIYSYILLPLAVIALVSSLRSKPKT